MKTDAAGAGQLAEPVPGARGQSLRLQHIEVADAGTDQQIANLVKVEVTGERLAPGDAVDQIELGEERRRFWHGGFHAQLRLGEERQLAGAVRTAKEVGVVQARWLPQGLVDGEDGPVRHGERVDVKLRELRSQTHDQMVAAPTTPPSDGVVEPPVVGGVVEDVHPLPEPPSLRPATGHR